MNGPGNTDGTAILYSKSVSERRHIAQITLVGALGYSG